MTGKAINRGQPLLSKITRLHIKTPKNISKYRVFLEYFKGTYERPLQAGHIIGFNRCAPIFFQAEIVSL